MSSKKSTQKKSATGIGTKAALISTEDLLERLSARLALIETVASALRRYEDAPELGSICVALGQAVALLGKAHEDVDCYLRQAQR